MELAAAAREVEQLAEHSASAAMARALHLAAAASLDLHDRPGALALSGDRVAELRDGALTGQASWIGPVTPNAVAIVAGRSDDGHVACAVPLDAPGVTVEIITTAALDGVSLGHATFDAVPCTVLGPTPPTMARVRVLLSAVGLGIGRRALHEALAALKAQAGRPQGAGGEQTVQGLLADAATELEAAAVLIAQAALSDPPSLAEASMAKLAATEAAQRSVSRATQVVGAEAFTRGHILEQLVQDVRALELFAGRTEALREAVAEILLNAD